MSNRLKNKLNRTWRKTLYVAGMEGMLYSRKKAGDVIVMYHGVSEFNDIDFHTRCISRGNFRRQLLYYKKEFRIVSLRQMMDEPNPGIRRLAITFDDGLKNNFNHAAVVLRRLNVPATFFVSTPQVRGLDYLWPDAYAILIAFHDGPIEIDGQRFERKADYRFISTDNGIPLQEYLKSCSLEKKIEFIEELRKSNSDDPMLDKEYEVHWKLMDETHIKTLARQRLFTIGSHAVTHQNFSVMTPEQQVNELAESKKYLEDIIGREVTMFSFPDGDYDEQSKQRAYDAGYKRLFAVNYKVDSDWDDPNFMDRIGLYQDRSWIEQLHQLNTFFYA